MPDLSLPPGGPGGAMPSPPVMPGNPAGGPAGPGSSPALTPGGGGGNMAAATAMIRAIWPALLKVLPAFSPGSKEAKALLNAIRALQTTFPPDGEEDTVPPAIQQIAMGRQSGMPPTPPPGLAMAKPPVPSPASIPPGPM